LNLLINIRQGQMLISAREAVRRLGVKPATLYAYVSRGLVRSTTAPSSREHLYYAADIERLKRSKRKGRRTGAPPRAFDLYAPVLDTSLSLIEEGRVYYRGRDATHLAQNATLEEVAELMWGSDADGARPLAGTQLPPKFRTWLRELSPRATPIERANAILVRLACEDVGAIDTTLPVVLRVARSLVPALAAAITGKMPTKLPIHRQLATAWRLDAAGADLVRRSLVLVADHELNPSTYAARCVASTRASPYAVVLAALCALSGPLHGGDSIRVEAMLQGLVAADDLKLRIADRLRLGERLPGFGHPLYPQGDPRGLAILDALKGAFPKSQTEVLFRIASEVQSLIGRAPNVDFALGAMANLLRLPPRSGLGLFVIGRSVGWIAHAIEQYATGTLIRPRARYVGVLPLDVQGPDDRA
jgi:citrate synthase